jgi:hypothetical protein
MATLKPRHEVMRIVASNEKEAISEAKVSGRLEAVEPL